VDCPLDLAGEDPLIADIAILVSKGIKSSAYVASFGALEAVHMYP
jgi:hypothetical protein